MNEGRKGMGKGKGYLQPDFRLTFGVENLLAERERTKGKEKKG